MAHRYPGKAVCFLLVIVLLAGLFLYSVSIGDDRDEKEAPVHQCGCPKDKVLSHTCCCALSKRKCCAAKTSENAPNNILSVQTSATPTFCRTRCSLPEELIPGSSGNIMLTVASCFHEVFARNSLLPRTTQKKPRNAFLKVPVPPPENSTLSSI